MKETTCSMLICYRKHGALRFISHLDTERTWRRAVRRAGLPIAFSAGFSPREKIEMGYPLPVGCSGEAENLILELKQAVPEAEIRQQLHDVLPEGLEIVEVKPYRHDSSLFQRTRELIYQAGTQIFALPVENGRSVKLWEYLSRELGRPEEEVKLLPVTRKDIGYHDE